ncbi:MAG: hypothetical protein HOP23_17775 [Methylococcaceae bacterium]|nr:hypothetical protein [Methylococcaceae bacterium]
MDSVISDKSAAFFVDVSVFFDFWASVLEKVDLLVFLAVVSAESTVLSPAIFVESESSVLFERFFTLLSLSIVKWLFSKSYQTQH